MLRKAYLYIVVLVLCFRGINVVAQDPTFSQFYTSGLYLNPAIIALEETSTISLHSRTQWKSVGTNFQTDQASLMFPLPKKDLLKGFWGGFGLSLFQDKTLNNTLSTSGFTATMSSNIQISKKSQFTLGVQGGVMQKKVQLDQFKWTSQYDPFIGYDATIDPGVSELTDRTFLPDLNAGILYFYNYNEDFNDSKMDAYAGVSVYHLTQPDEAVATDASSKLPMNIKFHAGADIKMSRKMNFNPNVLATTQASNSQVNVGAYVSYMFAPLVERWNPAYVVLGGWYRLGDAYIVSAGIGGSYYSLAFSYDMNSSSLRSIGTNVNAYEVSLKLKKPTRKLKSYHTPRV